jgi:hypothetical protein
MLPWWVGNGFLSFAVLWDFGKEMNFFWLISQCILIGWSITCALYKHPCDWPNVSKEKVKMAGIALKLHWEVIRKVKIFLHKCPLATPIYKILIFCPLVVLH